MPAHKSLFGKHNEHGLPIGNLTSQFWGNVYFLVPTLWVGIHIRTLQRPVAQSATTCVPVQSVGTGLEC